MASLNHMSSSLAANHSDDVPIASIEQSAHELAAEDGLPTADQPSTPPSKNPSQAICTPLRDLADTPSPTVTPPTPFTTKTFMNLRCPQPNAPAFDKLACILTNHLLSPLEISESFEDKGAFSVESYDHEIYQNDLQLLTTVVRQFGPLNLPGLHHIHVEISTTRYQDGEEICYGAEARMIPCDAKHTPIALSSGAGNPNIGVIIERRNRNDKTPVVIGAKVVCEFRVRVDAMEEALVAKKISVPVFFGERYKKEHAKKIKLEDLPEDTSMGGMGGFGGPSTYQGPLMGYPVGGSSSTGGYISPYGVQSPYFSPPVMGALAGSSGTPGHSGYSSPYAFPQGSFQLGTPPKDVFGTSNSPAAMPSGTVKVTDAWDGMKTKDIMMWLRLEAKKTFNGCGEARSEEELAKWEEILKPNETVRGRHVVMPGLRGLVEV